MILFNSTLTVSPKNRQNLIKLCISLMSFFVARSNSYGSVSSKRHVPVEGKSFALTNWGRPCVRHTECIKHACKLASSKGPTIRNRKAWKKFFRTTKIIQIKNHLQYWFHGGMVSELKGYRFLSNRNYCLAKVWALVLQHRWVIGVIQFKPWRSQ